MNSKQNFAQRTKYKILYSSLGSFFILISLVVSEFYNEIGLDSKTKMIITPILSIIGLGFIILAVMESKCPVCKKFAGIGWKVNKCKHCGESFSE